MSYYYGGTPLVELLGGEDSAYALVEDRDTIASMSKVLSEVERKLIHLRFVFRPQPAGDR